ncbi:MAG TPA: YggS family pyridoxal phosphate-dependent enzyme [Planctomycetaceae bacterium]|jgi:pyridoxal phosphate enzyme (YggS family)|nr:YggS family pyridoxal phosphate-dependent enzyme [Planctomycetaceae bacterium]
MSPLHERIRENLRNIQQRVAAACGRAGRDPAEINLVAVTKYASEAAVRALYDVGHRDFGESRPLQLAGRAEQFPPDVRWHLIGHLQRNKASRIVPLVHRIHSVDSLRLLRCLDEAAAKEQRRVRVLLEVNVSGEASKDGYSPDALLMEWGDLTTATHLDIVGLMTMAPLDANETGVRTVFRGLRRLCDELVKRGPLTLPELSMGMSGDYEIAIEEGATHIRIGSALFDGCDAS